MKERTTKYVSDALMYIGRVGHATNTDILEHLRNTYPNVTATTVHRMTARLVERKQLALAPAALGNAMRFDTNTTPHDHFQCSNCGLLRDASIADVVRPIIEKSVGDGCRISGRLVITGLCKKCNEGE